MGLFITKSGKVFITRPIGKKSGTTTPARLAMLRAAARKGSTCRPETPESVETAVSHAEE